MQNQPINEPTLMGKLTQLLEHMDLAEMRVGNLRSHLFGDGESSEGPKLSTTVSAIVNNLGTRLASLCGELATVNTRLGCTPEPRSLPSSQDLVPENSYKTRGI